MKTCTKCGETKSLADFKKDKAGNPLAKCIPCLRAYHAEWTEKNRDKVNRNAEKYRLRDHEAYKARCRKWYEENKDRARENARKWIEGNPDRAAAIHRAKYERRPEHYAALKRSYAQKNAEALSQYKKEWRVKNKHRVNAVAARRAAGKLKATPPWLTAIQRAQIDEQYDIAIALTTQTGVKHHVDHVHPLRGKNFRGLHVPWNLQVLTAQENMEKNDRAPLPHEHLALEAFNA